MAEVVPRCGAGAHQDHHSGESDELRSRACLHGQSSGRVCESSLCPSARLGDDSLEWKQCAQCFVSHVHVLVERPGCG